MRQCKKPLRLFQKKDDGPTIKIQQTILARDDSQVQLIALDQQFRRQEVRITFSTPVEIRLAEMLYHGITLDISPVAIRVNLKRVYTIEKDDSVRVTFPELASDNDSSLLIALKYKVLKIQHDERRSQIILGLQESDDELDQWWLAWLENQQARSKFDVDHQLLNVVSHIYQRLYNQNLNKGLLWLSHDANEGIKITALHLNHFSEHSIQPLLAENDTLDIELFPLQQLTKETCPNYLLLIYKEDDQQKYLSVPCDNGQAIKSILAQFNRTRHANLFLLQAYTQSIDLEYFNDQIEKIDAVDNHYAQQLNQQLSRISTLVTFTDITTACQQLVLDKANDLATNTGDSKPTSTTLLARPLTLDYPIERKGQRFLIKTAISLHIADQRFNIKTDDVSEAGLSFTVPGRLFVPDGTVVRISFERWQTQTKKVKLDAVPFIVRRIQYWEGRTTVGLERNVLACGEKMNSFFTDAIEENKSQLALDRQDILSSCKAQIFSHQLLNCLSSTPLFIAMTPSKKRILQAVATTQSNQAAYDDRLWQTLQVKAQALSEYLKSAQEDGHNSVNLGLYCYLDSQGNWIINTEQDFDSATQKSLFINRALLAERCRFFHCSFSVIKPDISSEQEADLNRKLAQLRQHSPANVRKIKDVIHSLTAIGELTDITQVFANAMVKS